MIDFYMHGFKEYMSYVSCLCFRIALDAILNL